MWLLIQISHDDVIKWKHFPRYWPFVRGIRRSPVISPHKGQWHGALIFSSICTRINGWVNNGEADDLRRYRAHYDVTVMRTTHFDSTLKCMIQSCHSFAHVPTAWLSTRAKLLPDLVTRITIRVKYIFTNYGSWTHIFCVKCARDVFRFQLW